jgi:hypothetical protein
MRYLGDDLGQHVLDAGATGGYRSGRGQARPKRARPSSKHGCTACLARVVGVHAPKVTPHSQSSRYRSGRY